MAIGVWAPAAPAALVKLTSTSAAAGDWFGIDVAVHGGQALVGSYGDDVAAADGGAAYLFDAATGVQLRRFLPNDPSASHYFGRAVDLDGGRALIGTGPNGIFKGAAYLFDAGTGAQLHKFTPDAAALLFGQAVALDGGRAVIGDERDLPTSGSGAGAVSIYDATTGTRTAKVGGTTATSRLGISVAVDGATVLAGAIGESSAYVIDAATGTILRKLTPADAATGGGQGFGTSVAVSGNLAVVGAHLDDEGESNAGAVYVFNITTGTQLAKLIPSDAGNSDRFGLSVAIDGGRVVGGSYLADVAGQTNAGAAYLFDALTATQLAKYIAPEPTADDRMGLAVDVESATAIIANYFDDDDGINSGSAFVVTGLPEPIPEPTAGLLLLAGGAALAWPRRAGASRQAAA